MRSSVCATSAPRISRTRETVMFSSWPVSALVAGLKIAGERYEGPRLLIFRPGDRITVKTTRPTRMMFLGGDALEGPRHIWWNFVSSSKERI